MDTLHWVIASGIVAVLYRDQEKTASTTSELWFHWKTAPIRNGKQATEQG